MAKQEIVTKTFKSIDGVISTWYYEKDRLNLGPFKVEIKYPDNYTSLEEDIKKKNKKVSKTNQRFINPKNGKEISYQRAKTLGLVK
jgi:hypothetical protein